jgi:hypothetical protein
MCGITGYFAFATEKDKVDGRLYTFITLSGLYMQERGRRSWGWSDGKQVVKATGTFEDGWNGSFAGWPQAAVHTRQPTTGAVTEENAHPFKIGDVIGLHNGIVRNHEELNTKYNRECGVDSQHIFHHVSDGLDLSDISAYGAIVYWKDGKMYFGRFNNGDLTVAKTSVGFVFASTVYSLRKSVRLAGLNKDVVYYKLKDGALYTFEDKEIKRVGDLPFKNWVVQTTPAASSGYGQGGYQQSGWGGYQGGHDYRGGYQGRGQSDFNVSDRRRFVSEGNQVNPTAPAKKGKSSSAGFVSGSGSINDKIAAMIQDAVKQSRDKKSEMVMWDCMACREKIVEGDKYYPTNAYEFMCETCGMRNVDELARPEAPLTILPDEVYLVSALMHESDDAEPIECDNCHEKFEKEDYVVMMPDENFICWQCFVEGDVEAMIAEDATAEATSDELGAKLEQAEEEWQKEMMGRAEQYAEAVAKDDAPKKAGEMKDNVIQMPPSTLVH